MRHTGTAMILALLAMAAPGADAQTVIVDEGVFQLSRNGQPLGTETFVIQRTGSGADASFLARGRIVRVDGAQELRSSLQLQGAPPRPTAYELIVEGDEARRILARAAGRRFSVRSISPGGEHMREFLVPATGMVVDENITHHYFFVARRFQEGNGSVEIIVPQRNTQATARVESRGVETVTVDDTDVAAHHLVVIPGGGTPRHLWVDEAGRILRLTVPAHDFVARREAPTG